MSDKDVDLEKSNALDGRSSGELTAPEFVHTTNVSVQGFKEEHLRRALSARQVSMIAIGGSIGTGLFLSTGRALAKGGPASLVICYSIVGFIVYLVMLCLGEMTTEYPLAGSFTTFSARFLNEPFSFSIGYNYLINDAVSVAGDLTAAQVLMDYWLPNGSLNWLPSLLFWVALVAVNMIHVRAYGELEYALSLLKVVVIVIFFFLGIAVNVGAGPDNGYIGAKYWQSSGGFVNGFRGFASLFVTASFAYGGTESIGITAGEQRNPSRNVPRTIRRVFWRIAIFYILTTIIIAFDVPYDFPNLSSKSTTTSPFTIIWEKAGAKAAGSFMNAVIMTSVLSAGNHALYAGSRVLYGLSTTGHAPKLFLRTNKNNVPYSAVLAVSSVSLLFFGASFLPGSANQIWTWSQNIVGVSNQLAWWTIGLASWRFRRAWKAQGRSVSQLRFPAPSWAAPFVVLSVTVIILVQGWSAFAPWDTESFFANYVELPVFALLYVVWWAIKRSKTAPLHQVDLDSHRYVDTPADLMDNERIERREHGKFGVLWRMYSWIA
ncbi:Basic amino-acid permease [Microbotryomycetes sp. JL201]|nr:Basic amino-acid permease [Microbotryomycetes sp. JL201]